ncbi:MAG TPA: hypothetical protein VM390_10715, partial [Acidimicrobiales bacterium]|nr:hypothetical protein [Acidimicrobiales bacterium]
MTLWDDLVAAAGPAVVVDDGGGGQHLALGPRHRGKLLAGQGPQPVVVERPPLGADGGRRHQVVPESHRPTSSPSTTAEAACRRSSYHSPNRS